MSRILKSFAEFSPINETVQAAKQFLIKNLKDKKREKDGLSPTEKIELTPAEEKKALNDPRYIKIRDYIVNDLKKPGLVYPFTYFSIAEDVPFESSDWKSIENLLKMYNEASKNFSYFSLPQKNIDNYTKLGRDGGQPAHEILYHDLEEILKNKELKEFVDKIRAPKVRAEFKKTLDTRLEDPLRAKAYDELITYFNILKKIKAESDKKGEKENPIDSIQNNSSKYLKKEDPWVAFRNFVDDVKSKADGWGTPVGEYIDQMNDIEPLIKVLYTDIPNGIVVTSSRTKEGMDKVCKIADSMLCIQDDNFYRYTKDHLQINIADFNLPISDMRHFTTMTIRPDGELKEAKTKFNHSGPDLTPYRNYKKLIREHLPDLDTEAIISSIENSKEFEFFVKEMIAKIKEKVDAVANERNVELKIKTIIYALGSMGMLELGMTEDEMKIYQSMLVAIMTSDVPVTYDIIMGAFLDSDHGGFWTMEDIKLFIDLTGKNYVKNDVKRILDLTISGVAKLPEYLETPTLTPGLKRLLMNLIERHPEIKSYVETNML